MINATKNDLRTIVKILAPSFSDNQSVNRCIKQDSKRFNRVENQIKYISRISLRNEMAFINDEKTGAILCNFSYGKKATISDDIYYLSKVSGLKLGLQLMKQEKLLKQIMPDQDFCHLWFIGVSNEYQGKGIGSEMIDFLKKICSEKNLPIYLETSNQRNLKFYEKNGFKLYHKSQLPMDNFELYFYCWNPDQN